MTRTELVTLTVTAMGLLAPLVVLLLTLASVFLCCLHWQGVL